MKKIDRKEFVQGVAALGVATTVDIAFGKEVNDMKKTELKTLASENAFDLIGKEWMLVTAGNKEKFNTMTASWGGIGWLWNRPVAFAFIHPRMDYAMTCQRMQKKWQMVPASTKRCQTMCE